LVKSTFGRATYLSIAMVSVIVGLLITFQFRTTSSIEQSVPFDRVQELTLEKKQLERDLSHLQEEAADLNAKLEEAGKGYAEAAGALESELSKIKLYAGLTPVEGPGVEVVLESQSGPARTSFYTIKDEDLLKVVNDLRGAGAEAIAVNGQRILATSEIRLAGNYINVNLTRLTPPYTVTAIGNPGTLKSSLEIKGGVAEYLNDLGVAVKVQPKDSILIPAYTGTLHFEHAKPAAK